LSHGGFSGEAFGRRQTAYVSGKDFVGTALHPTIIRGTVLGTATYNRRAAPM
jgi:hypothetical protein